MYGSELKDHIEEIIKEVESLKNDAQMFEAIKKLTPRKFENPFVFDKEGKTITKKEEILEEIDRYFKEHFQKTNEEHVEKFDGPKRKLKKEVTGREVNLALKSMKRKRKPGKDEITVEMIYFGPDELKEEIANCINRIFSEHEDLKLGTGILIPLQKGNKTKGPTKNLRPIILLEIIRKITSKILMSRSENHINEYLSQSQSAYRKGRSTTDILLAYKWIIAKVENQDLIVYITGIDMTSAFDTINRNKVLKITKDILKEDEFRILRVLMSDTTLEVRVNGTNSTPFISNIGSPQGDSSSGPIFTLYFENSLKEIRSTRESLPVNVEKINSKWLEKRTTCLPREIIYADDCDFLTEMEDEQTTIQEKVPEILKKDNLLVNQDKTEITILKREDKKEKEKWRKVIKLGSMLGDTEDIKHRKDLSWGALKKSENIWRKKKLTTLNTRLRLYSVMVKSVLLYNSGTWGLNVTEKRKMNSFHRKQLRIVAGVFWPHKIRNKALYKLTNTRPISIDIAERRWKLLGHVLRLSPNTPIRKAMKFFFEQRNCKKFRGRKRTNIISTINNDIKITTELFKDFDLKPLNSELNLHNIRVKAKNRRLWAKRVEMVVCAAYSDKST